MLIVIKHFLSAHSLFWEILNFNLTLPFVVNVTLRAFSIQHKIPEISVGT